MSSAEHENVIPAQAGIQNAGKGLDSHFCGNDEQLDVFSSEMQDLKPNRKGSV